MNTVVARETGVQQDRQQDTGTNTMPNASMINYDKKLRKLEEDITILLREFVRDLKVYGASGHVVAHVGLKIE